jgi:NADPH-dependent glutamate synthase beta subunit-like oxidoreductase
VLHRPPPNLKTKTAVVIGHGNVALDVARTLVAKPSHFSGTDICEHALRALEASDISKVHVVGRRGPMQAAFTSKELREMMAFDHVKMQVDVSGVQRAMQESGQLDRPRKRMLELLMKAGSAVKTGFSHTFSVDFLFSPVRVIADDQQQLRAVVLRRNQLKVHADGAVSAVPTKEEIEMECGLLVTSIGFLNQSMPGLPFDSARAVIPNQGGRVVDHVSVWLHYILFLFLMSNVGQQRDAGRVCRWLDQDRASGRVGHHTDGRNRNCKQSAGRFRVWNDQRKPGAQWFQGDHADASETACALDELFRLPQD